MGAAEDFAELKALESFIQIKKSLTRDAANSILADERAAEQLAYRTSLADKDTAISRYQMLAQVETEKNTYLTQLWNSQMSALALSNAPNTTEQKTNLLDNKYLIVGVAVVGALILSLGGKK